MRDKQNLLVKQAREWIGVNYHHQGYSRHGCDCIGLVLGVCYELNYDWRSFDIPDRTEKPIGEQMKHQINLVCGSPVARKPVAGDLLLFKIYNQPQHCAIATDLNGGLGMIHADRSLGEVVECGLTENWLKRLIAVYEIPLNG